MFPDCSWHSITGLCGCQQWFEKGISVWMEVLWQGAKKLRLFYTKHEGESLSIYHKLISHFCLTQTSNEATQFSRCCWKCSSVWQNVLNPHCFMVTDIKLITVWCDVYYIFWLLIDRINSAASTPAADPTFGGACSTRATLFICCGALREAERSGVKRNWKSDRPPKTVKWHSNNPETLAWTCLR